MKKRIITLILSAVMIAAAFPVLTGCVARENELRVYNWGQYMDKDVQKGFAKWYEEETGEKVKLTYRTFTSNEDVYTSIKTQQRDWDLVCPSDYMVDRLIKEKLVLPLDKEIIDITKDVTERLLDMIDTFDKGNTYFAPYIWGTMGIMYDSRCVKAKDAESWDVLYNPDKHYGIGELDKKPLTGLVYLKDQVRDTYATTAIYNKTAELSDASDKFTNYDNPEYQTLLNDIFTKYDNASIAEVKNTLTGLKNKIKKLESDEGKEEISSKNGGRLGLFWSCDAGFAMNGEGRIKGNKNLFYTVPDEGSNVWVDGWLIPKYAKNTKAANYFIKYLMEKENSIANAEYAGAPAANQKAMEELKASLEKDDDGFFAGTPSGFKAMYIEMMFPSEKTLERCAIMGDFGEFYNAMTQMFIEVKGALA